MADRLIDISGLKKVSVLGMGRSGLEVAKFFSSKNIPVFLSDMADSNKLSKTLSILDELNINYETGGHSERAWKDASLVVISPGISIESDIVKEITERNIPVISELELAFQLSLAPFIAVTGTNGKSTTTTLTGNFLSAGGFDVIVGGNIGIPLVEKAYSTTEKHIIVAEVSSFQLETVKYFRPSVSLLLNITSDHLDRHGTLENYLDFKCRIFKHQQEGDYVVINYDDPLLMGVVDKIRAEIFYFSTCSEVPRGMYVNNDRIYYKNGSHSSEVCHIKELPLPGEHNLKNTMAAMMASILYGVSSRDIVNSFSSVKGLRHRIEFVADIEGVRFIDDSKGTNPDAVIAALNAFKEPAVLIAGGVDKNMDFSSMCEMISHRVKGLVLMGSTSDILYKGCSGNGLTNITRVFSIEEAVRKAFSMSEPGDIVILSPGGASFDMFKNAEDRGEKFVEAVKDLKDSLNNGAGKFE